jgi:hypothetical protein
LLLQELREGRFRQGWGYDESQDLRLIQEEVARGGNWWERLSNVQKEVLPHLRMLSSAWDSVQLGDWILVPNLPEAGSFLIADVVGPYDYERLSLPPENDVNGLGKDYGHVLPVHLITEHGVNKFSEIVDARIRKTLKAQRRMWNVDACGDALETLANQYKAGKDFSTARSGSARFHTALELARAHAEEQFRERLGPALDSSFQAAEWEEPISLVLRKLYPGAEVRWVAGPREKGADVIVQLPNHFGGLPWLVVVQVKNYSDEIGSAVLEQLRPAHDHYSKEGKLLALVVMTTAERMAAGLIDGIHALEGELNVPTTVVLRKETLKILSNGLVGPR